MSADPGSLWRPAAGLSRRNFLRSALAIAGGLSVGGCSAVGAGLAGSDVAPGTVDYWDLFGGGDGVRMQAMLAEFEKTNPSLGLQSVTLAWGNPYYTKLSLATLGGKPPDLAVSHVSRVPTLVSAGLLQELTAEDLQRHDMSAANFAEQPWQNAQVEGKTYALPLDTHPLVLFYNTDIAEKAGLLDADGALRSLDGPDAFVEALAAAQKVTGGFGGVISVDNDFATNWRIFQSLYSQLGGEVLADDGTQVVLDDDKTLQVLEYLKVLSVDRKLTPSDVDYGGAVALFASGDAGFYVEGEWEITTFQTAKMPFSMTLFPNVYGGDKYVVQGDHHALIVPVAANPSQERTDEALTLAKSLLDQSLTWAEGGHVPSWKPVLDSEEYQKLKPQSNYAAAGDATVLDPPAWYSGSGSNFENVMGSAIASVRAGQASPEAAVGAMRAGLETYAETDPPA